MVKKIGATALSLALGGFLAFADVSAARDLTGLSFVSSYTDTHPAAEMVFKPFMEEAARKFEGQLSFRYLPTNAVVHDSEAYAAISDGRMDIGQVRPSVHEGKMNLLGVVALPGMAPNAIVGSLVTEELIQKFPEVRAELPSRAQHLTAWTSASYQIHTVKPVKAHAELKEMKIVVWDTLSRDYVEALGAKPILMSSGDTYLALTKGMADGVICPLAPLRSFKISNVAKHHFILDLGVNSFVLGANKDVWDSMTNDMRKWISAETGMKMALAIGQALEAGVQEDIKWMEEQCHTFYYAADSEREAAFSVFAPFEEAWKKECEAFDPKLVEKVLKFAHERSAYHTAQYRAGKYAR